jgi:UDP-2,3-diacylglucosamine hydrolase
MTTLFISDLHLDAERPEITNQLMNFLKGEAVNADALYILGDLFESWVGDDDPITQAGQSPRARLLHARQSGFCDWPEICR